MNIPKSILEKSRLANKMTEEDFKNYLENLENEGKAYIDNFLKDKNIKSEILELCINLYLEYSIFSKIEYEDISRDKLNLLHNIIKELNEKYEKEYERQEVRKWVVV